MDGSADTISHNLILAKETGLSLEETVDCRSGADLAAAFANPQVRVARILVDIRLVDSDWAPYAVPVPLQRNFTVTGAFEDPTNWSVLNLGFVRAKVALGADVQVRFTRVVLKGYRTPPMFQAPGLDLLISAVMISAQQQQEAAAAADTAPGDASPNRSTTTAAGKAISVSGLTWFDQAAMIHKLCIPPAETLASVSTAPRPAEFPGKQMVVPRVAQPLAEGDRCVDDSSRWDMRRCWPAIGYYNDITSYGYNVDEFSHQTMNGYFFRATDVFFLCELAMSEDCVRQYNILGCYKTMLQQQQQQQQQQPAASGGGGASGASGNSGTDGGGVGSTDTGEKNKLLVIVLPSVLLGSLLVGVGSTAVIFRAAVVRGRRRRYSGEASGMAEDKEAYLGPFDIGRSVGVGGTTGAISRVDAIAACERHVTASGSAADASGSAADAKGLSSSTAAASDGLRATTPETTSATTLFQPQRCLPAEVALMPVTELTPIRPVIQLTITVKEEHELATSEVYGGGGCTAGVSSSGCCDEGRASNRGVSGGREVRLLPNQKLGSGAYGRVVVGIYGGARVAVKMLNGGLLVRSAAEACEEQNSGMEPATTNTTGGGGGPRGDNTPAAVNGGQVGGVAAGGGNIISKRARDGGGGGAGSSGGGDGDQHGAPGAGAVCTAAAAAAAAGHSAGGKCCIEGGRTVGGGGTAGSVGPCSGGGDVFSSSEIKDVGSISSVGSAGGDAGGGGGGGGGTCYAEPVPQEVLALAQEVEVLARCQHPNIVRLLAASLVPSQLCLVMELMDTSLEGLLYGKARELVPLPKVIHIGLQVARALSYLHPTILHRDLKPANVLLLQPGSDKPVAKLADFGLSRLLSTVLITQHPTVGTAPYMAPETFEAANTVPITDRADVYSFGVILWEMLAGRQPWEGCNILEIAYLTAVKRLRPPLRNIPTDRCPPKLSALMKSCWDVDPERRPAAAEVFKALALVQEALSRSHDGLKNSSSRDN